MSSFHYGDVIWLDFDPSTGHEQTKRRPAVVVSNDAYNRYNNLVMIIPITSQREFPLHIDIGEVPCEDDANTPIHGWAEVEQLKSLDLQARRAQVVASLGEKPLSAVTDLVLGCLMRPTMTIRKIA